MLLTHVGATVCSFIVRRFVRGCARQRWILTGNHQPVSCCYHKSHHADLWRNNHQHCRYITGRRSWIPVQDASRVRKSRRFWKWHQDCNPKHLRCCNEPASVSRWGQQVLWMWIGSTDDVLWGNRPGNRQWVTCGWYATKISSSIRRRICTLSKLWIGESTIGWTFIFMIYFLDSLVNISRHLITVLFLDDSVPSIYNHRVNM